MLVRFIFWVAAVAVAVKRRMRDGLQRRLYLHFGVMVSTREFVVRVHIYHECFHFQSFGMFMYLMEMIVHHMFFYDFSAHNLGQSPVFHTNLPYFRNDFLQVRERMKTPFIMFAS